MDINLNYNNSSAVISEIGAGLKSLKLLTGRELVWHSQDGAEASNLVFPVAGTFEGGTTEIKGVKFDIPKCGLLHNSPFSYSRIAENDMVCTFVENNGSELKTPYNFTIKVYYRLFSDMIKIRYLIKNDMTENISYSLGSRLFFNYSVNTDNNYKLVFNEDESNKTKYFVLRLFDGYSRLRHGRVLDLEHKIFNSNCLCFDNLNSKTVFLTNNNRTGIRLTWSGFQTLAVNLSEKDSGKKFLSLQPWCGFEDYTSNEELQILSPGGMKTYEVIIEEVCH